MPNFVEIGPLVPVKIFEAFFTCMGIAAILVMYEYPGLFVYTLARHSDFISNLALIGQGVSENVFENCGRQRQT